MNLTNKWKTSYFHSSPTQQPPYHTPMCELEKFSSISKTNPQSINPTPL